jgi:hypothetical protein
MPIPLVCAMHTSVPRAAHLYCPSRNTQPSSYPHVLYQWHIRSQTFQSFCDPSLPRLHHFLLLDIKPTLRSQPMQSVE